MKTKIFLSLVLLIVAFPIINAQEQAKFTKNMKCLIQEIDSVKTDVDKFVTLGAKFERIGNVEKNEWLPYYYAGYCYAMKALKTSKESDLYANQADKLLDIALKRGGDKSEIFCVKSYVATARLMVNPQSRWMTEGKLSSDLINKAIESNPNNPRAYLLLGQSILHTPKEYGGGFSVAEPILNKAIEKFKEYKPLRDISPSWGEAYTIYLIKTQGGQSSKN